MKKRYKISKNKFIPLVRYLSKNYSLPNVSSSLVIYSFDEHKYVIEFLFLNNQIFYRFNLNKVDGNQISSQFEVGFPYISIKPRTIRFFLRMISSIGFNKVLINRTEVFEFKCDEKFIFKIQKNTYIGDILHIYGSRNDALVEHILETFCDEEITQNDVYKILKDKDFERENLIDGYGKLNTKIHDYCTTFGINISESILTINLIMGSKSNDYSNLGTLFKEVTGLEISSSQTVDREGKKVLPESISVIVPYFNSEETLLKMLESINSQLLTEESFKKIEVILIDDGSKKSAYSILQRDFLIKLKYRFVFIRCETNLGLSNARNLGAEISKNINLIFIDSDILLEENYLFEHAVRMKLFRHAVYFSLKRNIDTEDGLIKLEVIRKGIEMPEFFDDKRLKRTLVEGSNLINSVGSTGDFNILNETDNLRKLGNGRSINGVDLPTCVVGHNFSISKETFKEIGGFSTDFIGWGFEDTFFGAKAIAMGNFIIPVLCTGVYHINHPARSGSEAQKNLELEKNLSTYKKLINETIE